MSENDVDREVVTRRTSGFPGTKFELKDGGDPVGGLSGESELYVKIKPNEIKIEDMQRPDDYYFKADVDDEGCLRFAISTTAMVDGTKQRHSDLYAANLAKKAVIFFEEQGESITELELNWHDVDKINTNTEKFLSKLGKPREEASDKEIEVAVHATWSWGLARELGFDQLVPFGDKLYDPSVSWMKFRLKRKGN